MGRPKKDPGDRVHRLAVYVSPAAYRQLSIHAQRNGHPSAATFVAWWLNATWTPQIKEAARALEERGI